MISLRSVCLRRTSHPRRRAGTRGRPSVYPTSPPGYQHAGDDRSGQDPRVSSTSSRDLLDQRLDAVVPARLPQARDEVEGDAARRRGRRRSRGRTPRPGAPGRRRSGWSRCETAARQRLAPVAPARRRRCRRPARPRTCAVSRLAVGKPSSRPRWSPRTTTPSTRCGRPERRGRRRDVAGVDAGADVRGREHRPVVGDQRRRPRPRSRTCGPSRCSSARSPAALWPNRKFSPTTTSAACRCSTSTSWTNASADRRENSGVNGMHAQHVDAERLDQLGLARRLGEHRRVRPGPHHLGRVRVEGHHDRLARRAPRPASPRARSICWCPRWTPSKTPIVTTERPQPPGAASYPRHRCMPQPHRRPAAGRSRTTSARARPSRSLGPPRPR